MTGCNFPSAELLRLKRDAAEKADRCKDNDPLMRRLCQFVLAVDNLRLLHEEVTGCECWYSAVRKQETESRAA